MTPYERGLGIFYSKRVTHFKSSTEPRQGIMTNLYYKSGSSFLIKPINDSLF